MKRSFIQVSWLYVYFVKSYLVLQNKRKRTDEKKVNKQTKKRLWHSFWRLVYLCLSIMLALLSCIFFFSKLITYLFCKIRKTMQQNRKFSFSSIIKRKRTSSFQIYNRNKCKCTLKYNSFFHPKSIAHWLFLKHSETSFRYSHLTYMVI